MSHSRNALLVISCLGAFALGLFAGRYQPAKQLKAKQYQYDKLSREYQSVYLEYDRRLKSSELERNRANDSIADLHLRNKVLHNALKSIPNLGQFKEKIKSLSAKELENLMISEYLKSIK